MSQRGFIIESAIVPVFEELLEQDKNANKNLDGHSVNPLELIEPDQDSMDKALERVIEKIKEKNLSPEEKANKERDKQAEEIADEVGLTPEQSKEFRESLHRMQPVIHKLVDLFLKLRHRSSVWTTEVSGPYARGTELSIEAAINRFNEVLDNPQDAKVMLRREPKEDFIYMPKKIRLWVVPDLSGSMQENESDLKDISLALAATAVSLSQQAKYADSDLEGELGIVGFHGSVVPLIEPSSEVSLSTIAKCFPRITAKGGNTCDDVALSAVLGRLAKFKKDKKEGDVVDILIEITDGQTRDPVKSRKLVEKLKAQGVILGAVKIGYTSKPDVVEEETEDSDEPVDNTIYSTSNYDSVWNSGPEKLGQYVLDSSQLATAVEKILKGAISDLIGEDII